MLKRSLKFQHYKNEFERREVITLYEIWSFNKINITIALCFLDVLYQKKNKNLILKNNKLLLNVFFRFLNVKTWYVLMWCWDFWCFRVEYQGWISYEDDNDIISWPFDSPWKHRVIWMMFFQFRPVCKGFLLCRYRFFMKKFDSAKRRRKSLKSNLNEFKSFKNNMFDILSNRILIWHCVNCMRLRVLRHVRICSCYRMFVVCETLKIRLRYLLTLIYNNCRRHCKPYRHSLNFDNFHIKVKKFIAYMCVILLQHLLTI